VFDLRRIGCEMGGTSSELCPAAGCGINNFSVTRVTIVCFTIAGRTVVFDLT
jgi:hypothetical protein